MEKRKIPLKTGSEGDGPQDEGPRGTTIKEKKTYQ